MVPTFLKNMLQEEGPTKVEEFGADDSGDELKVVKKYVEPGLGDLQAAVIKYLEAHSSDLQGATLPEIQASLNLPIVGNHELLSALSQNSSLYEEEGRWRLRVLYMARNKAELLELIQREGVNAMQWVHLKNVYPGAQADLCDLVRRGEIVRLHSKDPVLFSDVVFSRVQMESSKVRVAGRVSVTQGECYLKTERDLRYEVFRNDIVWVVGNQTGEGVAFRVSSRTRPVRGGAPDDELCPTGVHRPSTRNYLIEHGAHFSAVDTLPHALHHSRAYYDPFTDTQLPLDRPWEFPSAKDLTLYRLGCSGDTRVLWREIVLHSLAKNSLSGVVVGGAAAEEELEEEVEDELEPDAPPPPPPPPPPSSSSSSSMPHTEESANRAFDSIVGANAFKTASPFPATHRELREEMLKIKMTTRMLPGTLDTEMVPAKQEPQTADERAKERRKRGPRALDSRLTKMDEESNAHLNPEQREKKAKAARDIVMKTLRNQHLRHDDKSKGWDK